MTETEKDRIIKIMPELKVYRTLNEIADNARKFLDKYEIIDKEVVQNKEKVEYIKQVMKKVDYNDSNEEYN